MEVTFHRNWSNMESPQELLVSDFVIYDLKLPCVA
jgi:hypothetical protein